MTEDEIISMVYEGHDQGVLDADEAEMIQNIFEMDDKKAGDIMIHRKNIKRRLWICKVFHNYTYHKYFMDGIFLV